MKKSTSKICAFVLALALICSFITITAFGTPNRITYTDAMLLEAAGDVLDAYEEHYNIIQTELRVTQATPAESGIQIDYYLDLDCVLKYTSALQLPHVKGLCAAMGIDVSNLEFSTLTSKLESGVLDATISTALTASEAQNRSSNDRISAIPQAAIKIIASEMSEVISNLEENSIGNEITMSIGLRAIFDANGNLVKTQYGAYNNYTDQIAGVIPESVTTMIQNGYEQANEIAKQAQAVALNCSSITSTTYFYSGTAAASYAQTWTSDAGFVYCSACQQSRKQDSTKYNTSAYPTYSCCNDCANYVSQAMRAGGITTDSTWQPYSYAWMGTISMQNYFYNTIGLWKRVSLGTTQPGDILSLNNTSGSFHVGIITQVDTVTRTYCGHTNDRLNQPFNGSTFNGEATSVDYFTFNAEKFPGIIIE